jgi:hypothetical protein
MSSGASISSFVRQTAKLYLNNRYQVDFLFKSNGGNYEFEWEVISVSIPPCEIKQIGIPYFGAMINFGLVREFVPLSMTVYDTTEEVQSINRKLMEGWGNSIFKISPDGTIKFANKSSDYMGKLTIHHNNKTNTAWNQPTYSNVVIFENAFPSIIGQLDLSNETSQWASFTITWNYDYYYYQ